MAGVLHTHELTRMRIVLAYAIAVATDGLQLLLGPLGWSGFDEGADLAAMLLLTAVLGFHPLFLPTFVVELLPIADMLPTWTGCVFMVIALRRRSASPKVESQPTAPQP